MTRQLTGWALSLAVALTVSGSLAYGAGGSGGGAANAGTGSSVGSNAGSNTGSNSGSHVGSNEGTHVGSNEGTHVGSNEGMRVGTQDPNAPGNTNTGTPTNNRARNSNGVVNSPNLPPNQFRAPTGGGGDGGWWTTNSPGVGYDPNSVGTTGQPINSGQTPANGSTPPPTGPITSNGALTTANVPPPASSNNNAPGGMTMATSSRQAQVEGQLVDLLTLSRDIKTADGSSSPAASATIKTSAASANGSGNTTGAAARPDIAIPDGGATTAGTGTTGATASVRTTGGDTFGTYSNRGATRAPETPTAPTAGADAGNKSASAGSVEGKSLIITDTTAKSSSSSTPALTSAKSFDNTTISRQLSNGMPAAIISGGQMYVLACDPKQLASYAGQDVRVSGRLNSNGSLIPERLEVRQPSGFREITLIKPDMPSATASDR